MGKALSFPQHRHAPIKEPKRPHRKMAKPATINRCQGPTMKLRLRTHLARNCHSVNNQAASAAEHDRNPE